MNLEEQREEGTYGFVYRARDKSSQDIVALKKGKGEGEVKCLIHLHDNWILQRCLKTSNLLLSHNGILKVGDSELAQLKNSTAI